jgi:uncharacterized protein
MGPITEPAPFWETKSLDQMSRAEWESLCDGCGKCCLHKLEDEDTGDLLPTNVACKLLDRRSGQCTDYKRRKIFVPECVRLTPALLRELDWLPSTCAYRLIDEGKKLEAWHPLISGDPESVHRAGQSVRGWTVSELDAGDLEHHLVERDI